MKRSNNHLICSCGKHLSRQDAHVIGSNKRFQVTCTECMEKLVVKAQCNVNLFPLEDAKQRIASYLTSAVSKRKVTA